MPSAGQGSAAPSALPVCAISCWKPSNIHNCQKEYWMLSLSVYMAALFSPLSFFQNHLLIHYDTLLDAFYRPRHVPTLTVAADGTCGCTCICLMWIFDHFPTQTAAWANVSIQSWVWWVESSEENILSFIFFFCLIKISNIFYLYTYIEKNVKANCSRRICQ